MGRAMHSSGTAGRLRSANSRSTGPSHDPNDGHDPVRVSLEAPLKYGPELQLGIMQLEREGLRRRACAYLRPSCHANPIR